MVEEYLVFCDLEADVARADRKIAHDPKHLKFEISRLLVIFLGYDLTNHGHQVGVRDNLVQKLCFIDSCLHLLPNRIQKGYFGGCVCLMTIFVQ